MEEFLTDVKTLRERARENIEKGPVTDAYGADLERVIRGVLPGFRHISGEARLDDRI